MSTPQTIAPQPAARVAGLDRFAFLWIATLGLGGTILLFALDKPVFAGAVVTLTTSILGMMGWRAVQPLPPGGANLVLTGQALERSGISSQLLRDNVLQQLDPDRRTP